MKAKKLYYFAYGSNMLASRIGARVNDVIYIGTWVLKDWKMDFNCGHYNGSYANIFESKGDEVEGVLYEIPETEITKLDRCEVYPFNYEKRYFIHEDGNIVFAYVSVAKWFKSQAKPTLDYLDKLIDGAKENGLVKTYDRLLDYREYKYTDEEREKVLIIDTYDDLQSWFESEYKGHGKYYKRRVHY